MTTNSSREKIQPLLYSGFSSISSLTVTREALPFPWHDMMFSQYIHMNIKPLRKVLASWLALDNFLYHVRWYMFDLPCCGLLRLTTAVVSDLRQLLNSATKYNILPLCSACQLVNTLDICKKINGKNGKNT